MSDAPLKIVHNRPALASLDLRSGTYAEFKKQLVDGLSDKSRPALASLTTRDPSDFTLALLDGWACVADILTFYQERLGNESYLGTCSELLSVRELTRTLGYELGPGLAATTLFCFTVDDDVHIQPGLQVMSIPAPGESAVTFETIESLDLHPTYNNIPAVTTTTTHSFKNELRLATLEPSLKPGDPILLLDDNSENSGEGVRLVFLDTVTTIDGATHLTWSGFGFHPRTQSLRAYAFNNTNLRVQPVLTDEDNEPDQSLLSSGLPEPLWDGEFVLHLVAVTDGTRADVYPHFGGQGPDIGIHTAGRTRLGKFLPHSLYAHYNPRPLTLAANPLTTTDDLFIKGPPPSLAEGDALLVRDSAGERWAVAIVGAVRRDSARNCSIVTPRWTAGTGASLISGDDLRVDVLRQRAALFGHNAPDPMLTPITYTRGISRTTVDVDVKVTVGTEDFVHAAKQITAATWNHPYPANGSLDLNLVTPALQPGSLLVAQSGPRVALYTATDVATIRRQDYTLDAACTHVSVADDALRPTSSFPLTGTDVLFAAEPLTLAAIPLPDDITGPDLLLQGDLSTLTPGRTVIVTGQSLLDDSPIAEAVRISERAVSTTSTRIRISPPLSTTIRRSTLSVRANAVRATHGESRSEILGSGDASQPFQRFFLGDAPLTHLSAPTPSGRKSTLELRVGGLLWRQLEHLADAGPTDRVYTLETDPHGRTLVQFGDGTHGARLPNGTGNVRVSYRKGIGLEGQVRKHSLTLPLTRPPGVRAVTNPLPATGAADPEQLQDARDNATRSVIALGRVVSLSDYESFARAFTGFAKARATQLGRTRVALTVAGPRGTQILPGSDLHQNLSAALRAAGDPTVAFSLHTYDPVQFELSGTVRATPDALTTDVHAAVSAALLARFSFAARDFAQPVYFSEVVATIQSVPGVASVDIDRLTRTGLESENPPPAMLAASSNTRTELLTLDPACLQHLEVTP